ncbi:hypothetical protein RJG79_08225 [Mycoplasmatota bacterium WC44]
MKLEYIKINDSYIDLSKKVNILLANQNTGKTMLFNLIRFIYGNCNAVTSDNSFKIMSKNHPNHTIKWKFVNSNTPYVMSVNDFSITYNDKKLKSNEYCDIILKRESYLHKIFGENIKTINIFAQNDNRKSNLKNNSESSRMFISRKDMNYTSMKFLKLLLGTFDDKIMDYFTMVGRKKNLNALKNNSKIMYESGIEKKELNSINEIALANYVKLKTLNERKLSDEIIEEIISLELPISIEEIIDFHNIMVSSYNEVIENEKEIIKSENKIFQNYTKKELSNISKYMTIHSEAKSELSELNDTIENCKSVLADFDKTVEEISNDMNEFMEENNNKFNNEGSFVNTITLSNSSDRYKINISTLVDKDIGDGDRLINYINLLNFTLINSKFPILVFEKAFLAEIQLEKLIKIISLYNEILMDDKQLILLNHPDEGLLELLKSNEIEYVNYGDDKLFDFEDIN